MKQGPVPTGLPGAPAPIFSFTCTLIIVFLCQVAESQLQITSPTYGDVLDPRFPINITFQGTQGADNVSFGILQCSTSDSASSDCNLVYYSAETPQIVVGSTNEVSWLPSPAIDSEFFYRCQLIDINGNVATSGTFTFEPWPLEIDTT